MSYDRIISTAGFQPLTSASSTENMGFGHMAADIGIAIGLESLGAGLAGYQGGFGGGKPLMGMIKPFWTGRFTSDGVHRSGIEVLRRQAASVDAILQGNAPPRRGNWDAFDDLHNNTYKTMDRKQMFERIQRLREQASEKYEPGHAKAGKYKHGGKLHGRAKALGTTLGKISIGVALRTLSRAWVANDLFSMALGGAMAVTQGLETFQYNRAAEEPSAWGTDIDLGAGFAETKSSFTQRQRAMQAIHNSQMNTRAAMGNEATFMHV
jgi:hypothetical protein